MSESIRDAVLDGIRFIEANLRREIGVSDVAAAAAYSQFYFSREFSRHAHISVYDYILRRKLSEAHRELLDERIKIVDLAFRYGFQSHEVFTRAYRKLFHENPSESKDYKPLLRLQPIDGTYLDFLSGLRVEAAEQEYPDCCLAVTDASAAPAAGETRSSLALLSPDNPYRLQFVFHENLRHGPCTALHFRLSGLRHIARLHSGDMPSVLRYYFDHIHRGTAAASNYILLRPSDSYIDIILPKPQ